MNDASLTQIYSVGIATVKRWRAAGRRAGLPAPLTTPDAMPDWWNSMVEAGEFEKSCPMGILEAAGRMKAALGDSDDEDGDGPDMSGLAGQQMNYSLSIELAETNLKAVKVLLDSAVLARNEKKIVALQRSLRDAQSTLRELERDRGKIQAAAGETLPKEDVRAAMMELHSSIAKQFRQGIRAAFPDIGDHTASRESWNIFADGLVDRICVKLTSSNFAAE